MEKKKEVGFFDIEGLEFGFNEDDPLGTDDFIEENSDFEFIDLELDMFNEKKKRN